MFALAALPFLALSLPVQQDGCAPYRETAKRSLQRANGRKHFRALSLPVADNRICIISTGPSPSLSRSVLGLGSPSPAPLAPTLRTSRVFAHTRSKTARPNGPHLRRDELTGSRASLGAAGSATFVRSVARGDFRVSVPRGGSAMRGMSTFVRSVTRGDFPSVRAFVTCRMKLH